MRMLCVCLFALVSTAFAQVPVSKERDKEIEAIMARVESKEDRPEFSVTYKIEADGETQQAMIDALDRYLNYLAEDDVMATYNMLCNIYRKEVRFSDYAKKDRVAVLEVLVQRAWFDGKCALFRGSMKADTGTAMGVMRIPLKVYIFEEEGNWHVYKNPFEVAGFVSPRGRGVEPPCSFYDKPPAEN